MSDFDGTLHESNLCPSKHKTYKNYCLPLQPLLKILQTERDMQSNTEDLTILFFLKKKKKKDETPYIRCNFYLKSHVKVTACITFLSLS